MRANGNRQLHIRLPSDHWIWDIEDPVERNKEIRRALDFYRSFEQDIKFIKEGIDEIKKTGINILQDTNENITSSKQEGNSEEQTRKKLDASLEKFLDF